MARFSPSSQSSLFAYGDISITALSGGKITLAGSGGSFIDDSSNPNNTIATIGDIPALPTSTRWSPTFSATGLAFTGTSTTYPTYNSYYTKFGQMVTFWIAVDLTTVTNFGTGQYKVELPYAPLAGTSNHFHSWLWVNPAEDPDVAGHHILVADHLPNSTSLDLHYLKAGPANQAVIEQQFKQGAPDTLTTASRFYINGSYISAS
jgi:hypothetical protein